MGPHEPQSTLRRSSCSSEIVVDGEVYIRLGNSQRRGECEDVESPVRALGQGEEVTEELVTRPAVHSTADGTCQTSSMTAQQSRYSSEDSRETQMMTRPVSSASWQAGDAVRVCTTRDPEAQRIATGRHVTNGAQCGALVRIPNGHNEFDYAKDVVYQRSGVCFSSQCNESEMPGQRFLTGSCNDICDNYCVNPMAAAGQGGNSCSIRSSVGGQMGGPQLSHQRGQHLVMTEDPDDRYQGLAKKLDQYNKRLDQYNLCKRNLEREIRGVEKELQERLTRKTQVGQPHQAVPSGTVTNPVYTGCRSNDVNPLNFASVNNEGQVSVPVGQNRQSSRQDMSLAVRPREFRSHRSVYRRRLEQDDQTDRRGAVSSSLPVGHSRSNKPCHHRDSSTSSSDQSSYSGQSDSVSISSNVEGDGNHGEVHVGCRGSRRRRHGRRRRAQRNNADVRHNQVSKVPWMKPEKFNGHGNFETCLVQFENCATYCRWSDEDKAAHLRWELTVQRLSCCGVLNICLTKDCWKS